MKSTLQTSFSSILSRSLALSLAFLVSFLVSGTLAHAGSSSSLAAYFALSQALAEDSLPAGKEAAIALAKNAQAEGKPGLEKLATALAGSTSIEEAREKFKPLSRQTIQEASTNSSSNSSNSTKGAYYVMTCSMAQAEWLQASPVVANPYMGKKMLRCGVVKEQIHAASTAQ